jgi:prolyl-tRNA synthetase
MPMRSSRLLVPTLKEPPPEARGVAETLLMRAGLLRPGALLPLGARVRARAEAIARQELGRAGAAEARGPAVALRELLRREVRSPKQLPQALFSLADELVVAVAGELPIAEAIARIVARAGVATGAIDAADDAQALVAPGDGESEWLACDACAHGATDEAARVRASAAPAAASEPLVDVATPGKKTIADVAAFFAVPATALVKTIVYVSDDNQPLLALVRGDRAVSDAKLRALAGKGALRLASDAVVREVTGAEVGFAGAQGRRAPVFADAEVAAIAAAITGANRTDHHARGFNLGRDVPGARTADLRRAVAGDACARCPGGHYRVARGRIVAAVGRDEARLSFDALVAACVAQHHDADGIVWPAALAPFAVCIVAVGNEPEIADAAAALEAELATRGLDVLYDDRDERAGAKFKDADLVGIPLRVTVGKRGLAENAVELKARDAKETIMVPRPRIADELVARVQS